MTDWTNLRLIYRCWPVERRAAAVADTNVPVIVDLEAITTVATIPQIILAQIAASVLRIVPLRTFKTGTSTSAVYPILAIHGAATHYVQSNGKNVEGVKGNSKRGETIYEPNSYGKECFN